MITLAQRFLALNDTDQRGVVTRIAENSLASYGIGIAALSDGSVVVGSSILYNSYYRGMLVRLSPTGSLLWGKRISTINHCFLSGLVAHPSGTIYAVGGVGRSNDYSSEASLMAFSSAGTFLWSNRLYTAGIQSLHMSLTLSPDGNYIYAVGNDTSATGKAMLTKYTLSGNLLYQKGFRQAEGSCQNKSVCCDAAGNVYVTGSATYIPQRGFVAKYDSAGTMLWKVAVGQVYSDLRSIVCVGSMLYVNGTINTGGGDRLTLLCLTTDGTLIESLRETAQSYAISNGLVPLADGSVLTGSWRVAANMEPAWQRLPAWRNVCQINAETYAGVSAVDGTQVGRFPIDGSGLGVYGSLSYAEAAASFEHSTVSVDGTTGLNEGGTHTFAYNTGDVSVTDAAYSTTIY